MFGRIIHYISYRVKSLGLSIEHKCFKNKKSMLKYVNNDFNDYLQKIKDCESYQLLDYSFDKELGYGYITYKEGHIENKVKWNWFHI